MSGSHTQRDGSAPDSQVDDPGDAEPDQEPGPPPAPRPPDPAGDGWMDV